MENLKDHKPAGPLRGGKYSNFEGGTRVPFLVRWPARVKPGVSPALFTQIDLLASLAALTGQTLTPGDAPDSRNTLAALLGDNKTGRDQIVEQAGALALRQGAWKYIEPGKGARKNLSTNTEMGNDAAGLLFNLAEDLGETRNHAADHPDRASQLNDALDATRRAGRMPRRKDQSSSNDGKWLLNHSFMVPGLVATATSTALAVLLSSIVLK